jgi:hypothetical protein
LIQATDPRSSNSWASYAQGLLSSVSNPLHETNSFAYDFTSSRLVTTQADGVCAINHYNLLGQLTND